MIMSKGIVSDLISFAQQLFGGALTDWQYSILALSSVALALWFFAYVFVNMFRNGGRRT